MYKLSNSKPMKGFKCGVMLECPEVQAKARASGSNVEMSRGAGEGAGKRE